MCKVLIATGLNNNEKALEFMKAVAGEMSNGNTDGIGYSAINSKNELFMEKWHNNRSFLDAYNVIDEKTLEDLGEYKERLGLKLNYMSYGNITRDDLKTVTMHTRFATCGRTMENTHPFIYNETSLIHNGIINNDHQLNNKIISTCDSESALQLYLSKECAVGSKSVYQSFLDDLRGYWAFGILAKSKEGNYVLDVIKGGASLYFAYFPELGENCIMFATTKEIINVGAKALELKPRVISDLVDNSLNKFDAVTGKLIGNADFKAKKSAWESYYSKNEEKVSSFENQFLKHGSKDIGEIELVTYDKNFAALSPEEFTDAEMEIFDNSADPLYLVLNDYDEYLGSNYAMFFNRLPQALKTQIELRKKRGALKFAGILEIIEEANLQNGSFGKAWAKLTKLTA